MDELRCKVLPKKILGIVDFEMSCNVYCCFQGCCPVSFNLFCVFYMFNDHLYALFKVYCLSRCSGLGRRLEDVVATKAWLTI
jgi:hypothetical protein